MCEDKDSKRISSEFAGDLLLPRELAKRTWRVDTPVSSRARVECTRTTLDAGATWSRCGLGTVGQVGRSRNAQTTDERASGDYVTLGGRKVCRSPSPSLSLFLSYHLLHRATTALANSLLFASFATTAHLHQRSSSSPRPRIVYKQILPPFQTAFTIVRRSLSCLPGSTWSNEGTAGRSVAAMSLQLVELTEQTALRKIAGSQKAPAKENDSPASERVLKKLSNSSRPPGPPHFRRPESNSIPFHSTLRTASFPHLFSPPLFLSPILPFTAASIPHLSRAYLSPSHPT